MEYTAQAAKQSQHSDYYDYIIVGGGSAGCVLAARLSEDPQVRVCLLEAGGQGLDFLVRMPMGSMAIQGGKLKSLNWNFEAEPQEGLDWREDYWPRGKGLGGSSATNYMVAVRGKPSDYDAWAEQGCTGWSWGDVLPYFKKMECYEGGRSDLRGTTGPLEITKVEVSRVEKMTTGFIAALRDHGIPFSEDYNGSSHVEECVGMGQSTCFFRGPRAGTRCSAAAAFLHPIMTRQNLTILHHVNATKVIFRDKRAVGVQYAAAGGISSVFAEHEIILSCGSIGSPQLLLLSGVGPQHDLNKHSIPVVHDLPGVGKNLQDHLMCNINFSTEDTSAGVGTNCSFLCRILTKSTLLVSSGPAQAQAFISSDGSKEPDTQVQFIPGIFDNHGLNVNPKTGCALAIFQMSPKSRGEITLRSANPSEPPLIQPRSLSNSEDLAVLTKAVRRLRRICESPSFRIFKAEPLYDFNPDSEEDIRAYISKQSRTDYHPVGTCKMGARDDRMAVVDPELRVIGLQGLRVVDASVIPTITSGNTNLPTMMIAEKAADLILRGHKHAK